MKSRSPIRPLAFPRIFLGLTLSVGLLAGGGTIGAEEKRTLRKPGEPDAIQAVPAIKAPTRTAPAMRGKKATTKKAGRAAPNMAPRMPALAVPGSPPGPTAPGGMKAIGPLGGVAQPNLAIEAIVAVSSPEGNPNTGFCGPNLPTGGAATKVRFFIRNIGGSQAAGSTAAVHFTDAGMATSAVPALMPGHSHIVEANIPQGCWGNTLHAPCAFLLEADRNDDVNETDDNGDNYANGECARPAI